MREFSIVQDMVGTVERHWRAFFDPEFERAIVAALGFREYEIVSHRETETAIERRTRAVPRLDAASSVAKFFGAKFGYVEDGTFDKASRIWRVHTVPDTFGQRMAADMEMRVEPAGDASRRTLSFRVEAKVRGIGGMVESAFEKNLRAGWKESAAFMNEWMTAHP